MGKKRPLWLICVLAGIPALAAFWLLTHYEPGPSPMTLEWVLQKASADLPPGSTREQVEAWLDARQIHRTDMDAPLVRVLADGPMKGFGIYSVILGNSADANPSLSFPGDFSIDFYFGANEKLVLGPVVGSPMHSDSDQLPCH